MDNLALSVSKSITDFLEQNEKRFAKQHSQQEEHTQLLIRLQSKVEELETKCSELVTENKGLHDELEILKQKEDVTSRQAIVTHSALEKMQESVTECCAWVKLITAITHQVQNLHDSRKTMKEDIKNILENQLKLDKMIEHQQKQLESATETAQAAAAAVSAPNMNAPNSYFNHRIPIRSPSTSSFLNGNIGGHHSLGRHTPQSTNNLYQHREHNREEYEEFDINDQISEVSESAERFLEQIKDLNIFQKSLEKNSSMCSYDQ